MITYTNYALIIHPPCLDFTVFHSAHAKFTWLLPTRCAHGSLSAECGLHVSRVAPCSPPRGNSPNTKLKLYTEGGGALTLRASPTTATFFELRTETVVGLHPRHGRTSDNFGESQVLSLQQLGWVYNCDAYHSIAINYTLVHQAIDSTTHTVLR